MTVVASEANSSNNLLTVSEFAHKLRVDDTTVRRWIKTGALSEYVVELPHTGKRRAYRIMDAALGALMRNTTSVNAEV